jgi:hypothetical protein
LSAPGCIFVQSRNPEPAQVSLFLLVSFLLLVYLTSTAFQRQAVQNYFFSPSFLVAAAAKKQQQSGRVGLKCECTEME